MNLIEKFNELGNGVLRLERDDVEVFADDLVGRESLPGEYYGVPSIDNVSFQVSMQVLISRP